MSTSDHLDLEQGISSMITTPYQNSESDDDDIISICFSDADEASCYSSTFYSSTASGSHDDENDVSESRRDSSASDCSVYVEIFKEEENGLVKPHLEDDDDEDEVVGDEYSKECRICHLSLGNGNGVIELGCDCKNDLALAHSSCAERWFKIRGNRVCEICNSTVENVNVPMELELTMQHSSATNSTAGNVNVLTELVLMQQQSSAAIATSAVVTTQLSPPLPVAERPVTTISSFCRGHRLLNFLLACMVVAFVISWLFRFNVPSSSS